jgi:Ca2+-binding EF-hand superfamily protein
MSFIVVSFCLALGLAAFYAGPRYRRARRHPESDGALGRYGASPRPGSLRRSRTAILVSALVMATVLSACGEEQNDDDSAAADQPDVEETSPATESPAADPRFATLDANGDSYLDADEVAEWEDAPGVFRSWDADRDSELDEDEIAGNAFNSWDIDNNGKISEQEWEESTGLWYPTDTNLATFGDWDNDGDSELDTDEFAESFDSSALGESWNVDTLDEETFKTAYFELYDTNDDGRVTRSEWTEGSRAFGIPR